ncbi:MAG TPA: hypothetical protein VKU80_17555 [Planctomycetota bacterium]|nr:hypothetical protein [Planctomycetota bacterium]
MFLSREGFIRTRTAYHKAHLLEQTKKFQARGEIPDEALENWARYQAELDWKRKRVYDRPATLTPASVWQYDHREPGVNIRFNPDGPMVSVISLSFAELRELVLDGETFLDDLGEWTPDDEGHFDADG